VTSRACDHLLPRCPRVLGAWVGRIDERFEFNRRCCSAHSAHLSIRFSTRRFAKLFVKPFKPSVSFLKLLCQILSCINKFFLGKLGKFHFPSVNLIIVIIITWKNSQSKPIMWWHLNDFLFYIVQIFMFLAEDSGFFFGWWIFGIMIKKRKKN
jgi:hypothetical protein